MNDKGGGKRYEKNDRFSGSGSAAYGEAKRHEVTFNYAAVIAPLEGLDVTGAAYFYDYVYYESGVKYQLRFYFDYYDKVMMMLLGKELFS